MVTIVSERRSHNDLVLLTLSDEITPHVYNKVVIAGEKFDTVPISYIKKAVGIRAKGSFVGKNIEFIYEPRNGRY